MTEEQKHLYDLFCVFADFCERHGLHYYMAGGTLLGAVRHHGFIPWDDDIDVMMPVEDYERFLSFKEKLPKGLILQNRLLDDDYPFLFSKLCNLEYPFLSHHKNGPKGIYIDIFPLVNARAPDALSKVIFNQQLILTYLIQIKLGWQDAVPYTRKLAKLSYTFFKNFSVHKLMKLRDLLIKSITSRACTDYFFSPGGTYPADKEFYPKQWFDAEERIRFETNTFPAIGAWNDYLTRNYGHYMELPPKENRLPKHR